MTKHLLLALLLAPSLLAAQINPVQPLPGWTHLDSNENTKVGIKLDGNAVGYSSPVVAEIDGNVSNGLETAVVSSNGTLQAYKTDGQKLWSVRLPNYGCSQSSSTDKAYSSPVVAAIHGDGVPYVVTGYGGYSGKECDGGVASYRGSDGSPDWTFSIKKYSKKKKFWAFRHAVIASPALADTDGDGKYEIGFGSLDRHVYLLNHKGKVRWYYVAADTTQSSPAFADTNGDGRLEMLIGTDISANSQLKPPTKNGGYLYALNTKKQKTERVWFRDSKLVLWQTWFKQIISSSPAVGELLSTSDGEEVAIGTGCFFPEGKKNKEGKFIKVLSLKTGAVLRTLRNNACSSSTPAIGDLNNDGLNEVVATVNGASSVGGDGKSRITAWNPIDSSVLWSVIPYTNGNNDPWGGHFTSARIADIDRDGNNEVIAANGSGIIILRGSDGTQLNCSDDACIWGVMKSSGTIHGTPRLIDMDNDGRLDIIVGGGSGNKGYLYGWKG